MLWKNSRKLMGSTVLEVAGVSDALSKSLGSSNKINTAYATLEALRAMETSDKWVTRADAPKKKTPAKANSTSATKTKASFSKETK
jgi:small subunit ribosomal protein S5